MFFIIQEGIKKYKTLSAIRVKAIVSDNFYWNKY